MKTIVTWMGIPESCFFAHVFAAYPDLRVSNRRTEPEQQDFDALLLTGGCDISAEFLRQPIGDPQLIVKPEPERDAWEFPVLAEALCRRVPIFAICRGFQVLNVSLGGTLHLDIPHHAEPDNKWLNTQPLKYEKGAEIQIPLVNSSHHQALDLLGEGLVVEARCADDDVVEQVSLRDYPFALGVQYHPERHPIYRPLFDAFVAAVRTSKA